MSLNPKWVPMKWPCGPREIEQLKNDEHEGMEFQNTAKRWADPSSLRLLKDSPINCLVLDWASGTPVDQDQQSALKPLIQAGHRLNLSFIGRISTEQNLESIVEAGRAAGLDAIILEKPAGRDLALPAIVPFPNDGMEWNLLTGIYRGMGAIWPGAGLQTNSENSAATGGPTGTPSVSSNGWFSLLSREIAPEKIPWLDVDPPESSNILPAEEYCRTIADCRVYGSHWIVALDFWLWQTLLNEEPHAVETWAQITREIAFFERHAGWEAYKPLGVLAVVSDFAGLNAISSGEVLDFLNRSQVQFLAVDRLRMKAPPGNGLKGIIWMDDVDPSAEQHEQLIHFVQQGGLVIAGKYWGPSGVIPSQEDWIPAYSIYSLDKGKIVVANNGILDPYDLSNYAHLLIGHRNDFARVFNPGMTNCYCSLHPDGYKQIVQLVNYGPKPTEYMSLWVNARAKSGTLISPESTSTLECFSADGGTEFHIPKLTVNCTIEIERLV
jgi:hypothetical protein